MSGLALELEKVGRSGDEARIVLQWLARLRWLAVAGQGIATVVAVFFLQLKLPLLWIYGVIAITALSNVALMSWRRRDVASWIIPAVLLLDVFLLTALLLCTGGRANPFGALYLVHVAMAVVTAGEASSWLVTAAAIGCYGLLFVWQPTRPLDLTPDTEMTARWVALTLDAILIAYFVGRMTRSLRRHERALDDARQHASRNEQLAALTTLAAGAAHELNTPLSTIAVVAKELEVQAGGRESMAQDARLIRQEVDRCQFILSRMRVDGMLGEGSKSLAVQKGSIEELRKELQSSAGERLKVICERGLEGIALPVQALQQALGILVSNAMDASEPRKEVELAIFASDGQIVFEVRDQGTGMAPEVARRAGEPFFTTKPPGEGMGLGLFLARLMAERLGGSLRVESEQGKGTRARVEVPKGG